MVLTAPILGSSTTRGLLTELVSPLQLKLNDLFFFWNILIPVHSILLGKQTDLEGRPIKPRVQKKNESRNLWPQSPEGTQKPRTNVLQMLLPLVSFLSTESGISGSISRGLRALGERRSPYRHQQLLPESKVNWYGARMTPLRLVSSRGSESTR